MSSNSSTTASSDDSLLEIYFHYIPNTAAAVFGILIMLTLTILLFLRYCCAFGKSIRWMHWVTLTAFCEFLGFIMRYLTIHSPDTGKYALHQLLLLVSPNLLALCNYMALGKFVLAQIHSKTPKQLEEYRQEHIASGQWLIPVLQNSNSGLLIAQRISKFFLTSDVIAFTLQSAAGGLLVGASTAHIGEVVMDIALMIQLFFFAGFTLLVYRVSNSQFYNPLPASQQYRPLFRCLFITIGLMTTRNVYRFIEFASGFDGPVAGSEPAFYLFDTTVMILLFLMYLWLPMASYLPEPSSIQNAQPSLDIAIESDSRQFGLPDMVKVVVAGGASAGSLLQSSSLAPNVRTMATAPSHYSNVH